MKHPRVRVDENVLFVDEGSVLTSAGAASGIDLCLHILRRDLGVSASNHAARRLVAAPYRSGGQAQYVPRSVPEPLGERFAATREWALRRLDKHLTLDVLAQHAAVSPRTPPGNGSPRSRPARSRSPPPACSTASGPPRTSTTPASSP